MYWQHTRDGKYLFKMQETFTDSLFKEVGDRLYKNITNNDLERHVIHCKNYAAKGSC